MYALLGVAVQTPRIGPKLGVLQQSTLFCNLLNFLKTMVLSIINAVKTW